MTSEVGLEFFVSKDDNSVYVKLSGFEEFEYAEQYAEHLAAYLPLMLFETDVVH